MFNRFKDFMININSNDFSNHLILNTSITEDAVKDEQGLIYFGCGCFWGAEKCFWKLPGVITTAVGYSGGEVSNPSYNQVCSGLTGHAEVVKVVWNKDKIDITDLLKMFWECHDPTQKDRQGNDYGSQYRSAIYYTDDRDIELINSSKKAYQKLLSENKYGQIETEIKKSKNFFYAEKYHQQYLAIKSNRQYCSASPTKIELGDFIGAKYKLDKKIWTNFDWRINKCVLRSDNYQLEN
mgnify:CR=1 FL=1